MSDLEDPAGRAAEVNAEARPVTIDAGIVTRPAPENVQTIHGLLRHLRAEGLDCVPEPLDVQEGTERLSFIEGEDGGRGWFHQHTDEGLASAARLLRRIHDATRSWTPPDGAAWTGTGIGGREGDELVYCHGDPGPWNFIWHDREAVALIDWDYLHPGSRVDDVAYALRWFVPLRSDELAQTWHHFPQVPDRRHRIAVFLEAYGDLPRFDLVEAVTARMQATVDLEQQLAEAGQEPQRTWVAEGSVEEQRAEIAWVLEHRADFS